MTSTAESFAYTGFKDRLQRPLGELRTVEQLTEAVLEQEQAAIATRLDRQLQISERPRLPPTPTMRDEELKVIDLPSFKPLPGRPQESFGALQEWEGVITDVSDKVVYASLIDITAGGKSLEETAEIPIEEISDDDRSRLVRGAIFRWVIGYLRKASGTKMRGSVIYFRRTTPHEASGGSNTPPLVFEETNG